MVSAISLMALSFSFLPFGNKRHPKDYKSLYTSLLQGHDLAFSGSISKCFKPLNVATAGAIITEFKYYNDTINGAERIESNYLVQIMNKTGSNSTAYEWNYWRQEIFPNQSIYLYTSDVTFNKTDEKNDKVSECSFDQFAFSVIEYAKPA